MVLTAARQVMSPARSERASVTSSTAAPICSARLRSVSSISKPIFFTAAANSETSSAFCARSSTLLYDSESAPKMWLIRRTAESGSETPASVARSEKPTSCRDASCALGSVLPAT